MDNRAWNNIGGLPELVTPEELGISSRYIMRFLDALSEQRYCLHAFILARHNKLCFAHAAAPYTLDTPHRMYSAAKSTIALSVYRAIQEGKLHLHDLVADYFTDLLPDNPDPQMMRLTVRDLLMMATGQTEDPFIVLVRNMDADLIREFFKVPMAEAPGNTFRYNNTVPHIVYAVVERAVGMPFERYQNEGFCLPMGAPIIAGTNTKGQYNPVVSSMSARTLMKYALLYLNGGVWHGKQLIDRQLIREAINMQIDPGQNEENKGYGYQIWLNQFGGFRMDGGWGQLAIGLPEENLAAVLLSDSENPPSTFATKAFGEIMLKGVYDHPLAPDEEGVMQLWQAADRMNLAPQGKAHSEMATACAGGLWHMEDGMELRLSFLHDCVLLRVTKDGDTAVFRCGLNGKWLENSCHWLVTPERTIDNGVYDQDVDACMLSGAWIDDTTFEMKGKSLGAIGEYLYQLCFTQGALKLIYTPSVARGTATLTNNRVLVSRYFE